MFSTNTAAQISSASYRNPRRRQRPLDDSASPPNAKRQRSLLRDNTFDVHSHKTQNGTQSKFDKEETGDDIPSEEEPIFSGFASLNDIPIRGPKKAENCERINLSSILVNNDFYSVSHVSSLPDKVKEILQGPFRCVISQDAGYCLALTREHAILWAYPLPSASVTADDVHVLSLPRSSTHSSCSSDSLPMGTFTFPSSHSEPGLLVVIPSTGEIVFWETISNPSILGLVKQKQRGLQDSIPGLLSGELTTDIVSIEPAGVILILSTGRLYHVSIRDSQGKPALNFQFLSAQPRATGGGLLKGIRNAFSSNSWRRNIVAARAGRSYRRGQRTLLVATNSGLIEIWDVHWSSGGTLKTHVDSTGAIQEALGTCNILGNGYDYQVVDFTFREAATVCVPESEPTESRESLWVLVSVGRDEATSYFVVGVAIQGSRLSADRVYPVHSGTLVKERNPQRTPRLHVPNPGNTGFVVFESGVVLLSLMPFHESPSSQLLLDDEKIPAPFQDFITFREGGGYAVVGCGLEHARIEQKHPSCLAMVRNFGLIRISARPRSISSSGVDEGQIGTQSRLEQVVFYDAKSNPIDLACYEGLSAQPAVLEDAAIQISNDILRSSSRFVPTTVPSLSEQMSSRSAALRALVTYLNRHNVHLSYSAKWTLLSHAEKMAAHMAVWKAQGSILKESASGGTHLDYILGQMGERFKAMPDAGAGEDDLVRHWFIYDTWRMEYIIPWILHGIRDTASDCIRVDRELIRQIWQASELSLAVLETVFRFREENEVLYGLQGCRPDENGPPMPNYSEVAPLWSAGKVNYAETERLLDAQLNTCLQWMRQTGPNPRNSEQPNLTLIERIKQNGPKAFKALWQLYMERVHWCNSQASADEQDSGRALRKHYIDHRKTQLYKMAAMGLLDDSIRLAETLRDMDALVELIVELENQTRDRHPAGVGDPTHDAEMDTFQRRIDKYFQKFGEAWATPFYTRQILSGEAEMLLIRTQYREYVTRFLRARPGYAKLSWMNDILGEKDYASASRSLGEFAANHETNLWSKEVELAIGKLSRLATLESSETQDLSNLQADIRRFDDLSELARTQELLYEHITPAIRGAIDQSAELQLANEQLGKIAVRSKPALREALRRGLAKLVAKCPVEPDELIDILTLMDPISVTEGEDSEIGSHEFSLALKALKLSDLGRHDPGYCEILEKIVWRRCMIRDDWHSINSTKQKGDIEVESAIQSTALFKMLEDIKGFEIQSDTVYQLYAPSDIIDPSIFPHRLASRLLPEQRARLSEDLDEEVGLLRSYIEKDRLGDWFAWIVGAIKDRAAKSVCEH